MKRQRLFKMQGWLTILLIVIAAIYHGLSAESADLFKVVIAPFGAISLLLFSFFLFHRRVGELDDEEAIPLPKLGIALGIAGVAGITTVGLITWLGNFSDNLEHLVFGFSIVIGCVVFAFEKIRNLGTMALLTGVSEGATLLMLFFD